MNRRGFLAAIVALPCFFKKPAEDKWFFSTLQPKVVPAAYSGLSPEAWRAFEAAMESGAWDVAPRPLTQGCCLKVEPIHCVLSCVPFKSTRLKLRKRDV